MLEFVLATQNFYFSLALGIMLGIAILEGVTLMFGAALSGLIETVIPDFDADIELSDVQSHTPNALSKVLSWIRLGKVPALILLVLFLTGFGLSGLAIQYAYLSVAQQMMPAYVAVMPALFFAIVGVRILGGFIGFILPNDETEAVSGNSLVGKAAQITLGVARKGHPAEARVKDEFGNNHYIMVEPADEGASFNANHSLVVLEKTGNVYMVAELKDAFLSERSES